MESAAFYAYVLQCRDGSLYTGWTKDVQRRLLCHQKGKGAKYTRARLPVELKAFWTFQTQSEAMRFETHFKNLSRAQKCEAIRRQLEASDENII